MANMIKYSKTIHDRSIVTVIDGEVVKNRNGELEIDKEAIERLKETKSNIVIQEGNVIDIYCTEQEAEDYIEGLSGLRHYGNIRIHTK